MTKEKELAKYLDGLTFKHGRKLPKVEDIYHPGMGYFYVSFRRQLTQVELDRIYERFDYVDLVKTVHKSRYPCYRLIEGND